VLQVARVGSFPESCWLLGAAVPLELELQVKLQLELQLKLQLELGRRLGPQNLPPVLLGESAFSLQPPAVCSQPAPVSAAALPRAPVHPAERASTTGRLSGCTFSIVVPLCLSLPRRLSGSPPRRQDVIRDAPNVARTETAPATCSEPQARHQMELPARSKEMLRQRAYNSTPATPEAKWLPKLGQKATKYQAPALQPNRWAAKLD